MVLNVSTSVVAAPFSNGDFELPSGETGAVTVPDAVNSRSSTWIPGWTVTSGSVNYGQVPAGTPCQFPSTNCIDLNGNNAGTIEQTFDTVLGASCTVQFYMSRHGQLVATQATLEVRVNGASMGSFTHSTPGVSAGDGKWEPRNFSFVATPSTTLAFKSTTTTTNAAAGPQIDNVTVNCIAPQAALKVCKVAGPGVAVGTVFSFHAGLVPFTVVAGPGPGGTCTRVGPTFPQGTTVMVTESVPNGMAVSGITVAPPSRLVGTPNLAGGNVQVMIGSGITEVTFNNKKQTTGFLEICKDTATHLPGFPTFSFSVNPGNLGPFVIPAGSCSPAIAVTPGMVTITELPSSTQLVACSAIPAMNQGPCNLAARTSKVTVAPGDVSTQTIAIFTNDAIPIDHTGRKRR
jgi:hypothetical protein